jgi:hypothetical protein
MVRNRFDGCPENGSTLVYSKNYQKWLLSLAESLWYGILFCQAGLD